MAFTEAEKVKIRLYLGYPDTYAQQNTWLEVAIDAVGTRAATVTEVQSILTSLATLETSLGGSLGIAGLKRAEDIEWYQGGAAGGAITGQRSEGKRYCARLSTIFNMPLGSDAFGTSGYFGDESGLWPRGGMIPSG